MGKTDNKESYGSDDLGGKRCASQRRKQRRAARRPAVLSKFQKRQVCRLVTGERVVTANTKILRRKWSWSVYGATGACVARAA